VKTRTRVTCATEGAIARITLTRPDARNAIDPEWVRQLDDAVRACAGNSGIRAVLITAAGITFTVGGDLDHFAAHVDRLSEELEQMVGGYHRSLSALAELPVPVVCAAQGAIAGGGLGLLWCSDVVLLADDAKLATGFAQLGLSGDGGSSWYLPRLIGLRRSLQLILQGQALSAAEALAWNLVDRVVPRDDLAAEAEATAEALASGPTAAYGAMRRLIRRSFETGLAAGLDAELHSIVGGGATADGREGIAAFAERRPPRFNGHVVRGSV
jgi:enoyl-CoA hydratase/carnithine racemase